MIAERKELSPYRERKVKPTGNPNEEITFVIRDEGHSFDAAALRDPTDPENSNGRLAGLLLINAFMDEVSHNEIGNEIRMVKRKVTSDDAESDTDND